MKRIFVCSPLRPDDLHSFADNVTLARKLCLTVTEQGHAPFAPHLFFTQFLSDADDDQRKRGIEAGKAWLHVADEIWMFATEYTDCSLGMRAELWEARNRSNPHMEVVWLPKCWQGFWDAR